MKFNLKLAAAAAMAITAAGALTGCAEKSDSEAREREIPTINSEVNNEQNENNPEIHIPVTANPEPPAIQKATYLRVSGTGVSIRAGAGSGYTKLGTAEKDTLYTFLGEEQGWYKTGYKNRTAYISSSYCSLVDMQMGESRVESVIAEGAMLLGTPYVYGAVRYHDGKGNKLSGFTVNAFDCSSLMQYMFYHGADELLNMNTRTQIYQGTTVKKSDLKRGDLMFFTNASRKNNTGIERVGHVAMYLGDNYILHTASDYAKIEQISTTRWSYYIQAQRIMV